MSDGQPTDQIEEQLRRAAAQFRYPPTPDVAGAVRKRLAREGATSSRRASPRPRLAWVGVAMVAAIFLVALASVPDVQAAIRTLFRIGSITIEVASPTPTTVSSTPLPLWTTDLAGQTTLEDAQRRVTFPIKLPAYPPELGRPDSVFVQDIDGAAVVLVWLDPANPNQPSVALAEMTSEMMARKTVDSGTLLQETSVSGQRALWVQGPHVLEFDTVSQGRQLGMRYLVGSDVLIWTEGEITYRLESRLPIDELVRAAESLGAVPGLPTPGPEFEPFPRPTPDFPPLTGLSEMSGEATLDAARGLVDFPIKLPTYPQDLSPPDRVFVQYTGGPTVFLAWLDPTDASKARMSLHQLSSGVRGSKMVPGPSWLHQTSVGGRDAYWVLGPHVLEFYAAQGTPSFNIRRLVEGNVLIWTEGDITYRLETTLSMGEAVRIAESLRE